MPSVGDTVRVSFAGQVTRTQNGWSLVETGPERYWVRDDWTQGDRVSFTGVVEQVSDDDTVWVRNVRVHENEVEKV